MQISPNLEIPRLLSISVLSMSEKDTYVYPGQKDVLRQPEQLSSLRAKPALAEIYRSEQTR